MIDMIDRLIIAGGRDRKLSCNEYQMLAELLPVGEVVSGGARGVDRCGESWAKHHCLKVKVFFPDYTGYWRVAPLLRNEKMAEYSTALAIFPGGFGSADMLRRARAHRLTIYDFRKPSRGFFLFD